MRIGIEVRLRLLRDYSGIPQTLNLGERYEHKIAIVEVDSRAETVASPQRVNSRDIVNVDF
jgi:hypothetical protein